MLPTTTAAPPVTTTAVPGTTTTAVSGTTNAATVTTTLTTTASSRPNQIAVYGDATQDGVFDISDAVLTCRFMVGDLTAKIKDAGIASADVDGDGQLTSDDITLMLKRIARMISEFPVEEPNG